MVVSIVMGVAPKSMVYKRKSQNNMDDLGVPLFQETSISGLWPDKSQLGGPHASAQVLCQCTSRPSPWHGETQKWKGQWIGGKICGWNHGFYHHSLHPSLWKELLCVSPISDVLIERVRFPSLHFDNAIVQWQLLSPCSELLSCVYTIVTCSYLFIVVGILNVEPIVVEMVPIPY